MQVPTPTKPHLRSSFRDPGGRLYLHDDRVIRLVNELGAENARLFLASPTIQRFSGDGKVIETEIVRSGGLDAHLESAASLILEHSPVWFPSYPYEWPAEMLAAAAELTLDLAESLLEEGLGLKDATPFNVLFRGPTPVFVDALSVECRDPYDPIWRPMAQFQRTFLYPLMAWRYFGLTPAQTLGFRREGPEPEEIARMAGPIRRWLPPFLATVTLPSLLASRRTVAKPEFYRSRRAGSKDEVTYILRRQLDHLRRHLQDLNPPIAQSRWSSYQAEACHYSMRDRAEKAQFVHESLHRTGARRVLDVGANLGNFSRLAAGMGASVVAIDSDPVVAGELWRASRAAQDDILPLVVDLAEPTAAKGWRHAENCSFDDRIRGRFDCILCLAVTHHLAITHRIPVLDQLTYLAQRCRSLIWEEVPEFDPQVVSLLRGRSVARSELMGEFGADNKKTVMLPDSKRLCHCGEFDGEADGY